MVASLDFTVHSKVKCVCTVSQQGRDVWKGRSGFWPENCCVTVTKLVGITVQAAAVTRAVHSNHTQKGNKMLWVCKCSVLAHHISELLVPVCCYLRHRYKTYFGRTLNMFLILFLEITSDDVMRHPQLLAAKQPEGFPIMVKQSGCSSMERRVRSARSFLIIFTFSGCTPGECAVR